MKKFPEDETRVGIGDASTMISKEAGARVPLRVAPSAALEEHYTILETHGGSGQSGMGIVFIIEEKTAGAACGGGRRYAVKTFQPRYGRNLEFIERFIRESETWMLAGFHPNIVHAYRLEISYALPYLFMEYVRPDANRRNSLADHIRPGPLAPRQAVDFALQCCDGMVHAASAVPGLVHRDLKPDNMLVDAQGTLKISDFGLVRAAQRESAFASEFVSPSESAQSGPLTQTGLVFGTPAYMSPEQFRDPGSVTAASDIYAFGCSIYECLAGRPPFRVDAGSTAERIVKYRRCHLERAPAPLRTQAPDCPDALAALIDQCLEKDAARRPDSFAEIRDRLADMHARVFGAPPPARPRSHPTAREVAEQFRSLGVLRGYSRAVRMKHLRESREVSPYAFHLALASYFHCHHDPREERRQLELALRVRGGELGYEAVRRLGDLLVREGATAEARALLDEFLNREDASVDLVLEPCVRTLVAERNYRGALDLLDSRPDTLRTKRLRIELLQERGQIPELAALLHTLLVGTLADIRANLEQLTPDSVPGWAYPDDPARLTTALTLLEPGRPTLNLAQYAAAVWPDLSGAPDFAPAMAWLAEAAGTLAGLETHPETGPRESLAEVARLLGYPQRLQKQLERDEYWFWLREEQQTTEE